MASGLARTAVFRTLFLASVLIGTIALALALLMLWQTNALISRLTLNSVTAEAAALGRLASLGAEKAAEAIGERSHDTTQGLYLLLDAQDRRLAGNLNRWPPELAGASDGGVFPYELSGVMPPQRRLAIGVPVALAGGGRLLVARDLEQQRAFIDTLRWLLIAGVGTLALAAVATGLLASRATLARIGAMTKTSERIMAGNLAERIPVAGAGDELDNLALSLNAMLDRIGHLMAGLKEVSDNIAHDLKTPLTRLRNNAEAALREARGKSGERAALERAIEEADELIKTFDAMLLIARLDAGAVEQSLEPISVAGLITDIAELYEPVAEEQGLSLLTDVAEGLATVDANRRLLGQAIANLIDNAIKYGAPPEGSTAPRDISLAAKAGPQGHLHIIVADHGCGIPAGEKARALERFARLDTSRTRPGTGIGLSLVAAVARLHGGSVMLEDNEPGLRVILALPARAGAARTPRGAQRETPA